MHVPAPDKASSLLFLSFELYFITALSFYVLFAFLSLKVAPPWSPFDRSSGCSVVIWFGVLDAESDPVCWLLYLFDLGPEWCWVSVFVSSSVSWRDACGLLPLWMLQQFSITRRWVLSSQRWRVAVLVVLARGSLCGCDVIVVAYGHYDEVTQARSPLFSPFPGSSSSFTVLQLSRRAFVVIALVICSPVLGDEVWRRMSRLSGSATLKSSHGVTIHWPAYPSIMITQLFVHGKGVRLLICRSRSFL
ncbi:hypothetical protein Bca101_043402 [Brassica carinata]